MKLTVGQVTGIAFVGASFVAGMARALDGAVAAMLVVIGGALTVLHYLLSHRIGDRHRTAGGVQRRRRWTCARCGRGNTRGDTSCSECGEVCPVDAWQCGVCEADNAMDDSVCRSCFVQRLEGPDYFEWKKLAR